MPVLMPPPSVLRPELRAPLRRFLEAAFAVLAADVAAGEEIPFAIDERRGGDGPSLYAYRPLVGPYVHDRIERLRALPEHDDVLIALLADPGARSYAQAQAGTQVPDDEAVSRTILWPLLVAVAERQDGFDFDEDAFATVYGSVERTLTTTALRFEAFAPLVGLHVTQPPVDLGSGVTLCRATAEDVARQWPETAGLLPERFGIEPDRLCGLEIAEALDRVRGDRPPDAPRLVAATITALRLVSGGAVAGGPLVFERLELAARAPRPLAPDAATVPLGASVRLDVHALAIVRSLLARLVVAHDPAGDRLSVALARWNGALALPGTAERAVACLAALRTLLSADGGGDDALALRAAALAGRSAADRTRIAAALRSTAELGHGAPALPAEAERLAAEVDAAGRAVLAAAVLDDRRGADLPDVLDEVLLGARPRPQLVPAGLVNPLA